MTIEDPIEYEHPHRASLVEQVEIGADAPDFPTALRAALRQAPDVIVVGEMRDPETMRIALAASETGHLVFSTVHTTDAASDDLARRRLVSARAAEHDPAGALDVARRGPDADAPAEEGRRPGRGRGAALRQLRRAAAHPQERAPAPPPGDRDHAKQGSVTLEESLARLARDGVVELEEARARAAHPEEFENYFRGA